MMFWRDLLDRGLQGESWDCVDPRFGDISWPPEEIGFLKIVMEKDLFYKELSQFCGGNSLIEQKEMIISPSFGHEEDYARELWYGRKGTRPWIKRS